MSTKKSPSKKRSKKETQQSSRAAPAQSLTVAELKRQLRDGLKDPVHETDAPLRQLEQVKERLLSSGHTAPRISFSDYQELSHLRGALGAPLFALRVGDELAGSLQDWDETFRAVQAGFRSLAAMVQEATKGLRPLAQMIDRATKGDVPSICWWLERDPVDTLQVEEIADHINTLSADGSPRARKELVAIATAFRKGLLRPKRGRPPKIQDREAVPPMVDKLQQLYENAPTTLRRTYRRTEARRLDVQRIRRYFEGSFPGEVGRQVGEAVEGVLSRLSRQGATPTLGGRSFAITNRSIK